MRDFASFYEFFLKGDRVELVLGAHNHVEDRDQDGERADNHTNE